MAGPNMERCETCHFFDSFEQLGLTGFCRRYPPMVWQKDWSKPESAKIDPAALPMAFPLTYKNQWCGEHRRKPQP
jgi:hypothetical protein